jgi:outer membrane protein insertion porin family
LFLLLVPVVPARAQDPAGDESSGQKIVGAIRFAGNRRYTDEFLREQIKTKIGERFDRGLLLNDERALGEFFASVIEIEQFDIEEDGKKTGKIAIIFHVLDRTAIGRVEFKGFARVKPEDVKDILTTRPGRPLLEYGLKRDAELIARLHREKGYPHVEVKPYRRPTGKQDVEDIVFSVVAGPRSRILEVILEGAHSVKRKELTKLLKNSDRYRRQFLGLGKLFNPTFFDRAALEEDRRRLEFYYRQEGWLDARVVLVNVRFDDANTMATIHFRIDEGRRYRIRSFKVEYAEGALPAEKDRDFLAVKKLESLAVFAEGYAFRVADIDKTRRAIRERLWSRAYAKSRVIPEPLENPNDRSVDIVFHVSAGPKIRLGRIRIVGNRWTRDNVIRRQFRDGALPGEDLDIESLEAGRTRLQSLRFFSLVRFGTGTTGDPWGLVKSPNDDRPEEYDVELELEEMDTRNISFGAGISTDGGIFGFVSVTWRNFDLKKAPTEWWRILDKNAFRGGGQQFTLSFAPGTTFSSFVLAFSDPALNDSRWTLSTDISRRLATFAEYDQLTDGIYIRVGRFLDRKYRWRLTLEWSLREVSIDNPDPSTPVNALDEQGRTTANSIGFRLNWTRRREVDPFLNGYRSTFAAFLMGGPLGLDTNVWKLEWSGGIGTRTYRAGNGAWQRARVTMGVDWAGAFDDTPQVPIFERYFLGGRNLRGFEFREVGPKSNDSPSGGEFRWTVIGQYTFPLTDRDTSGFGIDIHFFLDQGTLLEDVDNLNWDTWRISAGFGVGIQFGSPNQPPLTIDFAWPIRDVPSDKTQVVNISFERSF